MRLAIPAGFEPATLCLETINSVVHGILVVARKDPFGLVDLYNVIAPPQLSSESAAFLKQEGSR